MKYRTAEAVHDFNVSEVKAEVKPSFNIAPSQRVVIPLLKPYPALEMEYYEVSKFVNNPVNDDEVCVEGV